MATYYITQNGSGAHDGSTYANSDSVAHHNAGSYAAGSIIYLCDTITSQVTPPSSGSGEATRITYYGNYAGHAVNITTAAKGIDIVSKSYITLDSITVTRCTGGGENGIGIDIRGTPTNSNYIFIKDCTVYCLLSDAIRLNYATNTKIQGSWIECSGNSDVHVNLIWLDGNLGGGGGTIIGGEAGKDNTFYQARTGSNYGDSFQSDGVVGDIEVSYNLFIDEAQTDSPTIQMQPEDTTGTVRIYNNIFWYNNTASGGDPIVFKGTGLTVYFEHNTVVNLNSTACFSSGNTLHPTLYAQNNIFYINSGLNYNDVTGTPPAGYPNYNLYYNGGGQSVTIGHTSGGNYNWSQWVTDSPIRETAGAFGDPLFTNLGTRDFTLQNESPAIELGNALANLNITITDDYLGNPRDATNPDVGAYEYEEGVSSGSGSGVLTHSGSVRGRKGYTKRNVWVS